MERPATLAAPATWAAPVLLVCRAMMVMAATKGPRAWQALLATRASLDCKVGEEGGGRTELWALSIPSVDDHPVSFTSKTSKGFEPTNAYFCLLRFLLRFPMAMYC